eukprot:14141094-Alexandrium_andersonii.AAC.1
MPLLSNGLSTPDLFLLLFDQARNAAINLTRRSQSGSFGACLDLRSKAAEVGHGVTELDHG